MTRRSSAGAKAVATRGLPEWAANYIGVPFEEHGRDPDGWDCWGCCRYIWAAHAGLFVPSYLEAYESALDGAVTGGLLARGLATDGWLEIPAGAERLFDGALMTGFYKDAAGVTREGDMHCGLVLAPGTLIHVERGIRTSLMRYREELQHRAKGRVRSFWRHRSLES